MKPREVEEVAYNRTTRKQDEQAVTHTRTHTHTILPHPTPRCKLSEKSLLKWILTRKEAIGKRACSEPGEVTTPVTTHECCPLAV